MSCVLFVFVLPCVCAMCVSTDRMFPSTENVQFSFVSLHCSSSSRRWRSRHGRRAGEEEGSFITAEFELDVSLEEVTGWFHWGDPVPPSPNPGLFLCVRSDKRLAALSLTLC